MSPIRRTAGPWTEILIKTRGHFPDEQAATKLIYLAILHAQTAWKTPYRWTTALRALKIHFGDRLPD